MDYTPTGNQLIIDNIPTKPVEQVTKSKQTIKSESKDEETRKPVKTEPQEEERRSEKVKKSDRKK